MTDPGIVVLGIPIPSSSPVFLSIVAVHVAGGLVSTAVAIAAMLGAQTGRPAPPGWRSPMAA